MSTFVMGTLAGIDVSAIGQGEAFNWPAYRGHIEYAFAKATEGMAFADPDYARNRAAAAKLGLIFGGYHFLHPDELGTAQADRYLSVASPAPGDLLAVDVEVSTDAHGGKLAPAQVSAQVAGFTTRIHERTDAWPIVYTTQWMAENGYVASAGLCPAWIADPSGVKLPNPVGPWHMVSFLQTGQRGLDTDTFFGDVAQLRRLAIPHPAPRPTPPPPPAPKIMMAIDMSHGGYAVGATVAPVWLTSGDGGATYRPVSR